jgi:glycosyltransferase involved in cell wall biosynthesis
MPPDLAIKTEASAPLGVGTVSIALCTFNGVRYLPAQLASYLRQDRLPAELVVGDDGSSDDTQSLIQEFARSAPFPVHFHMNTERLGVGRNFDQTIQRCRGEFIALSDQDDEWRPDKLRLLVDLMQQHPHAGYACSDAEMIGEDGQSLNQRLWEQYRCPPGSFLQGDHVAAARHLLLQSDRVLGATMLLRSACLKSLTPIPATWVHDHWYSVTCELIGAHGVATSEPVTHYRLHGQQTCGIRRPVGRYRQKKVDFAYRKVQRTRRRDRLVDLRKFLEERLIPHQPQLSAWRPLFDEADQIAEQAMLRDSLSWWRRKISRIQQWLWTLKN